MGVIYKIKINTGMNSLVYKSKSLVSQNKVTDLNNCAAEASNQTIVEKFKLQIIETKISEDSAEARGLNWFDWQKVIYRVEADRRFMYMLLGRLQADCEFYLNMGGRNAKYSLWAQDEQKQIAEMRRLWAAVPEKPEWLTEELINIYAKEMGVK